MLFIRTIAQFRKNSQHLSQLFSLSEDQLNEMFLLPHKVSFEPYMKAFQYKVLNSILFTNTKLCKFGYIPDDKCSFCKSEPETLNHVFFNCRHARHFWKEFERYYYLLTRKLVHLTLKDVIIGIINVQCPLLNYLILIAKFYIWGCRRNQAFPSITAFKPKLKMKYETENFICIKNLQYGKI